MTKERAIEILTHLSTCEACGELDPDVCTNCTKTNCWVTSKEIVSAYKFAIDNLTKSDDSEETTMNNEPFIPAMTVEQLIKELEQYPKDMPVSIGCDVFSPIEFKLTTWEHTNYPYDKPPFDYLRLD